MLRIAHTPTYLPERQYIYRLLLSEFLGLDYEVRSESRTDICITLPDDPTHKTLIIDDSLFQTSERDWLTPVSMPKHPLSVWNIETEDLAVPLITPQLPIIYGKLLHEVSFLEVFDDSIHLGLDVFGCAFFCLARYEEIVTLIRDVHGRFPAYASIAWHGKFLERPIVNEYLEILWILLQRLWPQLRRKQRDYRTFLSCDVDWPRCNQGRTPLQIVRSGLADIVKHRDPSLATRRFHSYVTDNRMTDPCNTFNWIMDLSQRHGLTHVFYFIADHSAGIIDGAYTLDDLWMHNLLRQISKRGHEIGLHPSYGTFCDATRTNLEFARLRNVMAEVGIQQTQWGGRQHYLRWQAPDTWQNYEDAGLVYDSTLSFSDHVGFRCGTCYEYPIFNVRTRRALALRERPLVVMEVSLFDYMNVSGKSAVNKILELNAMCRKFHGDFTMLWHNNSLISHRQRDLYQAVVDNLS